MDGSAISTVCFRSSRSTAVAETAQVGWLVGCLTAHVSTKRLGYACHAKIKSLLKIINFR